MLHAYPPSRTLVCVQNTQRNCDGFHNETLKAGASDNILFNFSYRVSELTFTWWYTGDVAYARAAVRLMRAFFFANETMMNPNFQYTQALPGVSCCVANRSYVLRNVTHEPRVRLQ